MDIGIPKIHTIVYFRWKQHHKKWSENPFFRTLNHSLCERNAIHCTSCRNPMLVWSLRFWLIDNSACTCTVTIQHKYQHKLQHEYWHTAQTTMHARTHSFTTCKQLRILFFCLFYLFISHMNLHVRTNLAPRPITYRDNSKQNFDMRKFVYHHNFGSRCSGSLSAHHHLFLVVRAQVQSRS